ncbi:hypothetical protein [Kordia sp.]|uniref:hypothetical protein n=1 Tax=Kordia sp. TaxID=1965332 RepID=UPI003D291FB6
MKTRFYTTYLTALAFLLVTSCASLQKAVFDQYSYQKGTEIKVDALRLMDKATTQYSSQTAAIDHLETEMAKIIEYEKNKPENQIGFAMWKMIANPDKKFVAGFLKMWKEKGTVSPVFIEQAKEQVTEALDLILQYEGKKDPVAENKLKQILGLQ